MMRTLLIALLLATGCPSIESQNEPISNSVIINTTSTVTPSNQNKISPQIANPANPDQHPQSADLNQRIKAAIQTTQNLTVDATDPMGEGSGFFDSDPRIVGDRVDCMTWVQWVLALAYAGSDGDPQPWLDAIRYYNADVGFDTRKHYVDRWLTLDPGPLVPIQAHSLSVETERIDLALEDFRHHHQYPCELYQSEMNHIRLDVISQEHLIDTIHDLAPGFYILFGIATDHYLSMYGRHSGPMAQVHPAILDRTADDIRIHHASTALEQIASVTLKEWIDANRRLHRSSTIYALDPNWTPTEATPSLDDQSTCEIR